ncbi:hypothetical protein [Nonlabens antarcticus]|uniref:hypothetical protein n=1 Tax=Nonlabens antarcticus TaxID=392714 RepID=UPI00189168E7|nr:hypothetical protein [Nonlabens antarcticus]
MYKLFQLLLILTLIFQTYSCINADQSAAILLDGMELNQFRDIDYKNLQKTIDAREDVKTGIDALRAYYPINSESNSENAFKTKAITNELGSNYFFFQQDNLKDDSLDAIAIWIEYDLSSNGRITILGLKESYQCKEGRGHQEWSDELCQ